MKPVSVSGPLTLDEVWRNAAKSDRTSQVEVLLGAMVARQGELTALVASRAEKPTARDGLVRSQAGREGGAVRRGLTAHQVEQPRGDRPSGRQVWSRVAVAAGGRGLVRIPGLNHSRRRECWLGNGLTTLAGSARGLGHWARTVPRVRVDRHLGRDMPRAALTRSGAVGEWPYAVGEFGYVVKGRCTETRQQVKPRSPAASTYIRTARQELLGRPATPGESLLRHVWVVTTASGRRIGLLFERRPPGGLVERTLHSIEEAQALITVGPALDIVNACA